MKTPPLICICLLSTIMMHVQPTSASRSPDTSQWIGLKDANLMQAVAEQCHPDTYLTQVLGVDGLWELFKITDGNNAECGYIDRFAPDLRPYANASHNAPPDCILAPIISDMWWDGTTPNRQYIAKDLYNLYPTSINMLSTRGWHPPGIVESSTFDNGIWRVGEGSFEGRKTMIWQPPKGFEGDVARIFFYMLTVYGDGVIPILGKAGFFIGVQQYPYMAEAAARQLIAWHRNDPVDKHEQKRNLIFGARQGNVNPYVEYPELAELLWGAKRGQAAAGNDFSDSYPTTPSVDSTPLRATYTLADTRINLHSPHIPSDATWSINGTDVTTDHLLPSQLGIGIHELRFSTSEIEGKVLIEITQ